jgi:glucokinase
MSMRTKTGTTKVHMILAGDIGGTKVRFGIFKQQDESLIRQDLYEEKSASGRSLIEMIQSYLQSHPSPIEAACFGVPGPVIDGKAQTTNLPWLLDAANISRACNIPTVHLVNDLQATVAAIPFLPQQALALLHNGAQTNALSAHMPRTFGLLAPGTGLGQAFLLFDGTHYIPLASEGGHCDFSAHNEEQSALFEYLQRKFKRVSRERVLCGPGIGNIFDFLIDTNRATLPAVLAERLAQSQDRNATITQSGLADEFPVTAHTLNLFLSLLGAAAGDLVLTLLTTGGMYLGGGIPPKILPKLKEPALIESYTAKGRLSTLPQGTSLSVILDDTAALLGAAHIANNDVKLL